MTAAHAPADESGFVTGMKQKAEPLLYALGLLGSPYKRGGTDPEKGVDCSGFVRHVYKQTEDIDLPHSAKAISQKGEAIDKAQLAPGDLVFFNTTRRPNSHVGIYAGNGKFVHAASSRSKQVMVSDMNDGYWTKRFNGARRLLSGQPTAQAQ
ncbi:MAG: C40 family peptidase [Hydrogenophilaceae bacterium]